MLASTQDDPPQVTLPPSSDKDLSGILKANVENGSEGVDLSFIKRIASLRRAAIGVTDLAEFADGIRCGQICFVEETRPLTSRLLARLFAEALVSEDPEDYNIGFILGLVDALLQARKTHPGWRSRKKRKSPK